MADDSMSGCQAFAQLCEALIDEGYDYLCPTVERAKACDWVAVIYSHHSADRRVTLASGQCNSMDDACQLAVDDYNERQRVKARKAELLKISEVVEALELFGVKVEGGG